MRFIAGAFYGLIALNICVFIIMTAATFINWEDCYLYIDQWYSAERAMYFIFGIGITSTGGILSLNLKGNNV